MINWIKTLFKSRKPKVETRTICQSDCYAELMSVVYDQSSQELELAKYLRYLVFTKQIKNYKCVTDFIASHIESEVDLLSDADDTLSEKFYLLIPSDNLIKFAKKFKLLKCKGPEYLITAIDHVLK